MENRGWKYGAEAGLLKKRVGVGGGGGGEWDWHFSYLIFSRFIIFAFRSYFILCKIAKLCYAFEEELFFSSSIIL